MVAARAAVVNHALMKVRVALLESGSRIIIVAEILLIAIASKCEVRHKVESVRRTPAIRRGRLSAPTDLGHQSFGFLDTTWLNTNIVLLWNMEENDSGLFQQTLDRSLAVLQM